MRSHNLTGPAEWEALSPLGSSLYLDEYTPAYKHFITSNSLPVSDEVALSTLFYVNTLMWLCIQGLQHQLHIYTLEMCGFWLSIRQVNSENSKYLEEINDGQQFGVGHQVPEHVWSWPKLQPGAAAQATVEGKGM
ncbi:hypothetical protein P7K49_030911 [Saguinus oedipus]|uniref:Uncharacterized protein n=1 Tax=Saguinus oedipus TaxID=9490 RepID=A0ABQ9U5J9_SAGOE|nr:hypothetical protein P7K49_030911 [Saguinus oedipus]